MCALVSFLLLMSSHSSFTSVSQLHAQIFIFFFAPTTSLFDTDKERKRRTEKGALSFIVKEHFNTKGEYIQPHTSLPLSPSTIHFLQGCTGAEEEEERAEREERERNEKGGEGRARERMLGEKRAELKGSQKKKKITRETEREEERWEMRMKQMEGRAEVENEERERETGRTKGEAERRRGRVGEREEEEEEMKSRARRQKTTRGREKQEKHQNVDV